MTTYDESRSRKLSRYAFWSYVLQHVNAADPHHFVGLAGDFAGDIGVLTGWGVDPLRITVFEEVKAAHKSARWRYPNVPDSTIVLASIQKGIRRLSRVDSVYLDFGDTIDQPNLNVVKKVAMSPNIRTGAYLGMAFIVGTEGRNSRSLFDQAQEEIDRRLHWQQDDVHAYFSLPQAPYLSRALLLTQAMHALRVRGGKYILDRMWTYESRETGTGAHMLMLAFRKMKVGSSAPFTQLYHALSHPNFRLPGKESASRYLGKLTCLLLDQGNDPQILLGITKGTEKAYKRLGANNWYA